MNRFVKPLAGLCLAIGITVAAQAEQPAPAAAGKLTVEALGEMLRQANCHPEPIRDTSQTVIGYRCQFSSEKLGATITFRALPTADGCTVWFKVALAEVTELRGVPAEIFIKLLAANAEIGPAFFVYSDDESTLYLYSSTYAAGLYPLAITAQLEILCEKIRTTDGLWNPKFWPASPKPTAKPMG